MTASEPPVQPPDGDPALVDHHRLGVDLFNATWRAMEMTDRAPADDDRMLHLAHASAYHWMEAIHRSRLGTAANRARSEWLCSRVYAVLGRPEPAAHHARRVVELCAEHGIGDWDLAFGYEALARAAAVGGDPAAARSFTVQALAAGEQIAGPEERDLLLTDLQTIPGQTRFW